MTVKRRSCGYTLIEVLIAMMILALSLTVIFRIFSGGLRNIGIASDYSHAVMVAESVLAATGVTEALEPGETSGRLFDKYLWVRSVTPYQPNDEPASDDPPVSAYRVSVTVEWSVKGVTRSFDLSTLRLVSTRVVAGR
jgi:general secretion pathway protein I